MKEIVFYLDESGNSNSDFFSIGGFWYVLEKHENVLTKSQRKLWKLQGEIKNLEKQIKMSKPGFSKKQELKWTDLTNQEKDYFFLNLQDHGQNNISITADMKDWKKHQGSLDCTYIYNFLVFTMLKKLFNLTNDFSLLSKNQPLKIVLNCDERPTSPESKQALQNYLQWKFNEFFQEQSRKNPFIFVTKYQHSKDTPLIRYADYFVGLVNSVHKLKSGKFKKWDEKSLEYYQVIHQKIHCFKCFMYFGWTINSFSLSLICNNFNQSKFTILNNFD